MISPLTASDLLTGQAYIDGRWCDANDATTFDVSNPATGEIIGRVARCGDVETRRAIAAAESARAAWQAKSAKDRGQLLRKLFELMMDHQEDLARILTAEQGKPLAEARTEIAYSASFFEWFAEEGKRIDGDIIPAPAADKRIMVMKQGIGVVACITPWNFPSAMLGRKVAPALAAGCTVVCKPANETPFSALAIAKLAERAGIPPGVINILCGHTAAIGDELCNNSTVRKLTFTGSTAVGKKLIAQCANTVKRTSMELGGNAPFIVFEDADLDAAVNGALASKYRNAGQTCVCANRFLVHETVYDAFAEKLVAAISTFTLGNGADEQVTMGPLISEKAADNVRSLIDDAITHGALSHKNPTAESSKNFVSPTVLLNASKAMRVYSEEIFGPVAALFTFRTDAEALAMANDTNVGLAAYFYSQDIKRVWRFSEALEYGIVGINEGIISTEVAPFGGVKESGNGREGSKYGIDDYVEIKYLCLGGMGD